MSAEYDRLLQQVLARRKPVEGLRCRKCNNFLFGDESQLGVCYYCVNRIVAGNKQDRPL
jgi:hypothetical protein